MKSIMSNSIISLVNKDGKYVVLPSGELQIRNVNKEDGEKTYQCRTKHRLTGETKLSATAGKLVITGKTNMHIFKRKENNITINLCSFLVLMTLSQNK